MKIIALIPARYAAKRFPAKLMQLLGDQVVIVQTYRACVKSSLFDQVIVVTDSQLIADAIIADGGQVMMSKKEHQSGSDRIAEAVNDLEADIIINVQGDEPFIDCVALKKVIEVFQNDENKLIDLASLMQPIKDKQKIVDPNCVKVVVDNNNFAMYFSRSPIPFVRDSLHTHTCYYEHIGVYGFRRQALLAFANEPMTPLEATEHLECLRLLEMGKKIKMLETEHVGIKIDTPEDLEQANVFLQKK